MSTAHLLPPFLRHRLKTPQRALAASHQTSCVRATSVECLRDNKFKQWNRSKESTLDLLNRLFQAPFSLSYFAFPCLRLGMSAIYKRWPFPYPVTERFGGSSRLQTSYPSSPSVFNAKRTPLSYSLSLLLMKSNTPRRMLVFHPIHVQSGHASLYSIKQKY